MQVVLFEDERVSQLAPLAAAEPAFAIACGSYKLAQLATNLGNVCTLVRTHLRRVEAETFPQRVPSSGALATPTLFLNSRIVPSVIVLQRLKAIADAGHEGIVLAGEQKNSVAAALVTRAQVELPRGDNASYAVAPLLKSLSLPQQNVDLPLFEYPHDVMRHHLGCSRDNLEYRIKSGYREAREGLFVADNVVLGEHLATDAKNGPIVIDHDSTIGPFCFLRGPLYIGPKARVNEHASLKDCTSLGHNTKVGGEVEGSIIEPYSNKQHYGFLGHSYVGSWVNLGAGTTNSDLKNTYGQINMEYPAANGGSSKVATGTQFLGCFIGDYGKTAINTSIFTGKTIGICSAVYGFVTTNVPAFANYAHSFGQITDLPADVMIAIQKRMFARRQVPQRDCDVRLIRDLYAMAQKERRLPSEPLKL
jgi:glucose-1-phosphate thymidylyltransferase